MSVGDKATRTMVPIAGCMVKGLMGLTQLMPMDMDHAGYDKFPPREHDQTYHTAETCKDGGVVNPGGIPYPGITGAGTTMWRCGMRLEIEAVLREG